MLSRESSSAKFLRKMTLHAARSSQAIIGLQINTLSNTQRSNER